MPLEIDMDNFTYLGEDGNRVYLDYDAQITLQTADYIYQQHNKAFMGTMELLAALSSQTCEEGEEVLGGILAKRGGDANVTTDLLRETQKDYGEKSEFLRYCGYLPEISPDFTVFLKELDMTGLS